MIEKIIENILANQVVTGLSGAALIGGIVYQARQLPKLAAAGFLRWCTVELTVCSNDPAFMWVERWLSSQPYARRTHKVTLRSAGDDAPAPLGDDKQAEWLLSPGDGSHFFTWNRRWIYAHRSSSDQPAAARGKGQVIEHLHLRTLGRSQAILRDMVLAAHEITFKNTLVSLRIWRGWWSPVKGRAARPLSTLVLKAGQMQRILADLAWFQGAQAWYLERGIPYRRAYLFEGPPGTGKTSIVLALAGHLKRPVCVLNLASVDDDNALFSAIAEAPVNAILLLEDIDCATASAARAPKAAAAPVASDPGGPPPPIGVTKAGLLNALDGITTPDGRIFMMTTNHPELLDPALIRPGRADVREKFEYLGPAEQVIMAGRFYGDADFEPLAAPVSPAVMQAAFMKSASCAATARAELVGETP